MRFSLNLQIKVDRWIFFLLVLAALANLSYFGRCLLSGVLFVTLAIRGCKRNCALEISKDVPFLNIEIDIMDCNCDLGEMSETQSCVRLLLRQVTLGQEKSF